MEASLPVKVDCGTRRSRFGCVWHRGRTQPFASVWALWSVLCGVNSLNPREARRVLEGRRLHSSVFETTSDAGWLLEAHDLDADGRKAACAAAERFDPLAVARHHLRYCPACLALRYHAACFQHRAVTHCPVHGVPLEGTCRRCGSRVEVSFDAARRAPFSCPRCGASLGARRPPRGLLEVRPPIQATTRALDFSFAHHSIRAADARRRARFGTQGFGHDTWWWGEDPYVGESRWRPWVLTVDAETAAGDSLHGAAWGVLIDFVVGLRTGGQGLAVPARLADAIERLDRCILQTESHSSLAWAAALLIRHYGGPRALLQASRLRACGARAELYPLTPQRSVPVEENIQANGRVFNAELRFALAHQLKRIRRGGFAAIFEADDGPGREVAWHFAGGQDGGRTLHWRGLGDRRFDRLLDARSAVRIEMEPGARTTAQRFRQDGQA